MRLVIESPRARISTTVCMLSTRVVYLLLRHVLGIEDQILLLCDAKDPFGAPPVFEQDPLEPLCELSRHY